jgi:hypothetical protein
VLSVSSSVVNFIIGIMSNFVSISFLLGFLWLYEYAMRISST